MAISPPKPKGPPLNALRAFESAGRLGGFSMAAEELHVTPGAIAQHVKALEGWFGADLFDRRSQGVSLSPLGESVLNDFSLAFDQLGAAVQTLRSRANPNHIRIAALPSIAQLWLSPRLPTIRAKAPDATISVTAMEHRPKLTREPFDLSIFFDDDPSPGLLEVCQDVIFPVCAPSIAARLKEPPDLLNETFLHDSLWIDDWNTWMQKAMGGDHLDTHGSVFSLYSLAVEEAKNGAGVLMGHEALVHEHLKSGALIVPFPISVTLGRRICVEVAKPLEAGIVLQDILTVLMA